MKQKEDCEGINKNSAIIDLAKPNIFNQSAAGAGGLGIIKGNKVGESE